MKVILVIGKTAEQEAFIAKLGLQENQKIILNNEETTLVYRTPEQMSFNQNLYADYQICIGMVISRSRLALATGTYHLDGAKSPLQLIAELSKFNASIVEGVQKVDKKLAVAAPRSRDLETVYGTAAILTRKSRDTRAAEYDLEMQPLTPRQ